jgi:hypothetical protein
MELAASPEREWDCEREVARRVVAVVGGWEEVSWRFLQ